MDARELVAVIDTAIDRLFAVVDARFDGDPGLLAFTPLSEPWTARQILEHISLANHYLLLLIEKGARRALHRCADPADIAALLECYTLEDPRFEAVAVNNGFAWECPPHMVPKDESSPDEVRASLRRQAASCHAILDRLPNGEGVAALTYLSVQRLGRIDVYRYLWFLLQHMRRHLAQLDELEAEYHTAGRAPS